VLTGDGRDRPRNVGAPRREVNSRGWRLSILSSGLRPAASGDYSAGKSPLRPVVAAGGRSR